MRRAAWEQEQEARHTQREAELQSQLAEMRSELLLLKASVSLQQTPPLLHVPAPASYQPPLQESFAFIEEINSPTLEERRTQQRHRYSPPHTTLDEFEFDPHASPTFIQGSSNRPLSAAQTIPQTMVYTPNSIRSRSPMLPSPVLSRTTANPITSFPIHSSSIQGPHFAQENTVPYLSDRQQSPSMAAATYSPALLSPAQTTSPYTPPQLHAVEQSSPVALGKRRTPPSPASYSESDNSEDSASDPSDGLPKRKNGHDQRCLTIHVSFIGLLHRLYILQRRHAQHAMKVHIYRCMRIRANAPLPDSHNETRKLDDDEPVRFVWEKTAKKSPHNAAMKSRILKDIMTRRKRYKHVPDSDFEKKVLDAAFDQVFFTMRQNFKVQKDEITAMLHKRREDQKYLKARRRGRKKMVRDSTGPSTMCADYTPLEINEAHGPTEEARYLCAPHL